MSAQCPVKDVPIAGSGTQNQDWWPSEVRLLSQTWNAVQYSELIPFTAQGQHLTPA